MVTSPGPGWGSSAVRTSVWSVPCDGLIIVNACTAAPVRCSSTPGDCNALDVLHDLHGPYPDDGRPDPARRRERLGGGAADGVEEARQPVAQAALAPAAAVAFASPSPSRSPAAADTRCCPASKDSDSGTASASWARASSSGSPPPVSSARMVRADLAGVVDPLEQGDRGAVLGDDEEGLAPLRGLQPGQADRQVRGRAGGRGPAHQRGRQRRDAGQAALIVQVRGQVPRLEVGGAHDEQSAGRLGRRPQRAAEVPGPLQPAGSGQQRTQRSDLVSVHVLSMHAAARIRTPLGGVLAA